MADKDDLGRRGEEIAATWLEQRGMTVIARNWRCGSGEIDIVLSEGETTVFAEVKTRSSTTFGHPFEAITPAKAARLRRLAAEWCRQNRASAELRIDVVAVRDAWSPSPIVEHVRGAV
ncbi:YraN family protein [Diaminobutyricibacter sp. McL0608]|uniref:YraN family protein n=1 Tax=Leifsonia sp. McL0608 TaxID=3143537 RepID=UPI0031F30F29